MTPSKLCIMQDLKRDIKKYNSLLFLNPYTTLIITAAWTAVLRN